MTILFLDFDGVLHPDEAYFVRGKVVQLRADGHTLFEHAELLAEVLDAHQDVHVVLSTSWVQALGFNAAKARLPEQLQARIMGSTWHSAGNKYEWNALTRYQQIMRYVLRHNVQDWLAIDNDDYGWPANKRHLLVHTDDWMGLGSDVSLDELKEKLEFREVK